MAARRQRRRPPARSRPGPELVALGLVVVLYAVALGIGTAISAGGSPPAGAAPSSAPPAASSPTPSANPLLGEIAAILEVNARLKVARSELREILGRTPFRGSEVAFALRAIKPNLVAGTERIGRLASQPAAAEIGAQLELLYASANDTIDRASDLALGSDTEYREAARDVVAFFADLPDIDARLKALAEPGGVDPSPSATPSPSASAAVSPPLASADPNELLRDPGFETGTGAWSLRTTGGTPPTVTSGPPLGTAGSRSIRIDVPAGSSLADVGIGQGPIALHVGSPYVASVWIRSAEPRSAQLRIVGPLEQTYEITVLAIGPEAAEARLEFRAILDEPAATFWIDVGGPVGGTVELDDASFKEQPPG
jgi:hypothetical protein